MTTIDPRTTVADLVIERPSRARVLERLGLDYCCGGKRSLADACQSEGLDLASVVSALEAESVSGEEADEPDWAGAPLAELCEHIVREHHAFLRRELPRLSGLLDKVERAHGQEHPQVLEVKAVFAGLRRELEDHMAKEEQVLFPACVALAGGAQAPPFVPTAIAVMEDDHAQAAAALERLSDLTAGYDLDRALCNTHRATLDGLRELAQDLRRHIHEETTSSSHERSRRSATTGEEGGGCRAAGSLAPRRRLPRVRPRLVAGGCGRLAAGRS